MRAVSIGSTFLRIGALAFGGLGATLALIEREMVTRRGLLTREDVTGALTYTKLLPGSTVVQVVAYLGWRLGGWGGSGLATAAFLLPSAVFMLALAAGYTEIAAQRGMAGVRNGVLAAVVALLVLAMERLARPLMTSVLPIALGVAAFVMVAGFDIPAVWVVVAAGAVGVLVERYRG